MRRVSSVPCLVRPPRTSSVVGRRGLLVRFYPASDLELPQFLLSCGFVRVWLLGLDLGLGLRGVRFLREKEPPFVNGRAASMAGGGGCWNQRDQARPRRLTAHRRTISRCRRRSKRQRSSAVASKLPREIGPSEVAALSTRSTTLASTPRLCATAAVICSYLVFLEMSHLTNLSESI